MRNSFRTSRDVVISGRVYRAAVRILGDDDQLQSTPFALQGKEKLRLTLPPVAQVNIRDALLLDDKLYACCAVRFFPTYTRADFRRCAV